MATGRVTADAAGRVVTWDHGAEELLGYSEAEVVGKLVSDLIVPARFRSLHREALDHLARGGAPQLTRPLETYAVRSDGTETPITLEVIQTQADPVRFLARLTARQPGAIPGPRPGTHAHSEERRSPPTTAWEWQTASELARIWEHFDELTTRQEKDAQVVGWEGLGLPEKQAYPELVRWYLRLKERVGRGTKTGLEILNELLVRQSEHWRVSKAAAVYLGLIMPLVAVILTVILARIIPDVPSKAPIVPVAPTLAPIPSVPTTLATARAAP